MASDYANNPYATPSVDASMAHVGPHHGGIFRQGNILIVHRLAQFPPYCVRTNQPTNRYDEWTFRWHSPWVYLLLLFNILILAIVALVISKKITLQVPVSEYWRGVRFQRILIGWITAIVGICGSIALGVLLSHTANEAVGPLLAVLGAIVFLIVGLIIGTSGRVLTPTKIDGDYAWLKGACPEFLDRFPNA